MCGYELGGARLGECANSSRLQGKQILLDLARAGEIDEARRKTPHSF